MSEFDQRISQIQTSIETLTGSLRKVDGALKEANDRFEAMSRNAERIDQVSASVARLERLVDKLDKGSFTDKLREQVAAISKEIGKLNTERLQSVTSALQGQASALGELNKAQVNVNQNFRRAGEIVKNLVSTLGELSNAAGAVNTNLEGSIERVNKAMQNIGDVSGKVQNTVTALNSLQSEKYVKTAEALERIATAVTQISGVNLDIGGITSSASRTRPPRTQAVGPSAAAQKFASANNIDLTQFESKVTVQQLRQHLATQGATSQATQAVQSSNAEAAALVQKAQARVNKLRERAEIIDKALQSISAAEEEAFNKIATQYGYKTSVQRDLAYGAMVGRGMTEGQQRTYQQEARGTLRDFGPARADYVNAIGDIPIETTIKNFEKFAANDRKALEGLVRLRTELDKEIRKINSLLQRYGTGAGGEEAASGGTEEVRASLIPGVGRVARAGAGFSENIYRPLSYGLSQFGAALNSVIQITRGLSAGGAAGGLDALGGVFKLLHTAANTNAYYGLNLLPKGVGQVFQPKRSGVLMDIAEAFVGYKEGQQRTPLENQVRGLDRRADLMGKGLKTLRGLRDVETDPTKQAELDTAITQATQELKELRKTIRAYQEVIKREAERAAANPTPYQSTGRTVSESVLNPKISGADFERTIGDIYAHLSESEKLLSRQAQESFSRFAQGTSLQEFVKNDNLVLMDTAKVGKLIDTFYADSNLSKAGNIAGVNLPAYVDESRRSATFASVAGIGAKGDITQTLVHELVHSLVEATRVDSMGQVKGITQRHAESSNMLFYADARSGNVNRFTNQDLDFALFQRRTALNNNTDGARSELNIASRQEGLDQDTRRTLSSAASNPHYRGYLLNPSEIFAHVGEALISENRNLEQALRKIYGPELFEGVQRELAKRLPDVFTDEPLKALRERYKQLHSEVSSGVSAHTRESSFIGKAAGTTQVVSTFIQDFIEQFRTSFGPLTDQLKGLIGNFLGSLQGGDVTEGAGVQASIKGGPGGLGGGLQAILSNESVLEAIMGKNLSRVARSVGVATQGGGFDPRAGVYNYLQTIAREDVQLPLGLVGQAIKNTGIVEKVFIKIAEAAERSIRGQSTPGPLTNIRQFAMREIGRIALESQLPATVSFRDEFNARVRQMTGKNIQAGSFQQTATFNTQTGMTEFALSARTADGAMVSLNGHLDEFGRKRVTGPADQMSQMTRYIKEFFTAIPRQLGYQLTYQMTDTVQQALNQILSIQDELSEVAGMQGATGSAATDVKYDFLRRSVQTAQFTGQGFDEAVQTNLQNFKILGAVSNPNQRADLSNQLSRIQLGAQTAFGISLEQSLEGIPAILTSISDGLGTVEDPVQRTAQSIQLLQEVMDKMVLAQRATGVSGQELITVYARLAAGAKEYGLTSEELLSLTATSAVSIGKGSDETSNVLRALLEGTYSQENQAALRGFGITTKSFNASTNTIQNRDFNEVMADLVNFIRNPETKGQASQLFQVFGGPRNAQDIGKIIRGYAAGNERVGTAISEGYTGSNFDELVERKSENLQGSLKKLGAAGTELFNTFLVGTGAMDQTSEFFEQLADSATRLTEFLSSQGDTIKAFFTFFTQTFKYNLIGALGKDVNVFSPIARGMGEAKKAISAVISEILDFGYEGQASGNKVLRVLQAVGGALNKIEGAAKSSGAAITQSVGGAVANPRIVAAAQQSAGTAGAEINALAIPAQAARPAGMLGRAFNRFAAANPAVDNISSWWSNNRSRVRNAAVTTGDSLGSMLAPAGFDLVTGGLGKSNLINTAGATLAGTFLGAVTASPQLGLVGYGMAKSFMDNIDFSKFFGTSDTEISNFGKAIAEAIRQANLTPEQQKIEQQVTQAGVEQENAIGRLARENFGRIDQGLGLSQFDKQFTEFYNSLSRANRAILSLPGMGISSAEIEQYQRLKVQGERPRDYADKRFLGMEGDILAGSRFQAIEQVYQALGNDQLRNAYVQANVTDPTKFLSLFADLQEGKGELLKNEDIREILQAIQRNQVPVAGDDGSIQAAGGDVTASLETANDIIKRINGSLSEFSANAEKMAQMDTGLLEYGEFGTQIQKIDEMFAGKLADIRAGRIQGPEAERVLNQYDKSRQSALAIPGTLQNLLPLAQNLGLNTQGLEQNLYGMGAEGQQQLQQRFAQAQQANRFVQDYENRQRALRAYEATDQYKARNADVLREHEVLKKALDTDRARYTINRQYLDLLKSQTNLLNDQTGAIKAQNQTRQLISAGTPAQFNPASIFNTAGYSADQINKAIESALQKQAELEKMSPGYRKYFAEQQFLLQGQGGFKGVTGIDQGFLQEALAAQQSRMTPPQLEDLSQYSDAQLESILGRARELQGQAVALNPDLAGQYDDERIMIYRKNNQLLQETGLSQEYLRLAIQENTKSNETLRGHYNLPSAYRAPTVWDYYDSGGKETGDVNFPNKGAQGTMVPLSFAQKLAQEMMNAPKGGEGADLSAIDTTRGPGGAEKLSFYSGGSPAIYSDVVDLQADVLNIDGALLGQAGPSVPGGMSDVDEIRRMAAERRAEEREKGKADYQNRMAYEAQRAEERAGGRVVNDAQAIVNQVVAATSSMLGGQTYTSSSGGWGDDSYTPSPAAPEGGWWAGAKGDGSKTAELGREAGKAKDRLSDLAQTTPNTGKAMSSLAGSATTAVQGLKGVASLGTAASTFTGAVTALVTKVQSFDLARALQNAKVTINVTVNGQAVPANQAQVQINNTSGGGGKALSAGPAAKTRIS